MLASLLYQDPDTLLDTTPVTLIKLTMGQPVLVIAPVPSGEQLVPLLTTLVCCGLGSNQVPPDLRADTQPTALMRPV